MRILRSTLWTATIAVAMSVGLAGGPPANALLAAAPLGSTLADPSSGDRFSVEYFPDPAGQGVHLQVPASAAPASRAAEISAEVRALSRTGPSDARLDVVIVGDGYTAQQQDDFLADATAKWADVVQTEPYASYAGLFNVWAVEAVSYESGVSGDPTADVIRDTALGSSFWCAGTERLLCANIDKVAAHAGLAPDVDLVLLLANSTKYGGAGYFGLEAQGYPFTGVSTMSSDHALSSLIPVHEIGHSVGLLADEYFYDGFGAYVGEEPTEPNVSTRTTGEQLAARTKWWRWMGATDPAGGTVSTYEGARYYPFGIYRPTADSLMQTLEARAFNLPSREALIDGFYRYGDLITSDIPTGSTIGRWQSVTVQLADVSGLADAQLRWYVDGREIRRLRDVTTVTPARIGLSADRQHTLSVAATDHTDAIRDPQVRAGTRTTLRWIVGKR